MLPSELLEMKLAQAMYEGYSPDAACTTCESPKIAYIPLALTSSRHFYSGSAPSTGYEGGLAGSGSVVSTDGPVGPVISDNVVTSATLLDTPGGCHISTLPSFGMNS